MSVNSQLNSVIRQRSRTRPAENSVRAQGDMAVACGHSHTLALADEGHVFVSGSGASGQLALGDREDRQGMVRGIQRASGDGQRRGGALSLAGLGRGAVDVWLGSSRAVRHRRA